jgi:hypothetical protein
MRAFEGMTPEQKQALEELRELTAEIEELSAHHRDVRRPPGRKLIWRQLQALKAARRERVAELAREGLSPSLIAPAAAWRPER